MLKAAAMFHHPTECNDPLNGIISLMIATGVQFDSYEGVILNVGAVQNPQHGNARQAFVEKPHCEVWTDLNEL